MLYRGQWDPSDAMKQIDKGAVAEANKGQHKDPMLPTRLLLSTLHPEEASRRKTGCRWRDAALDRRATWGSLDMS